MNRKLKQSGFSLTEVLIAVGTLAMGMVLIAGVFPVAVHFTTETIERTTAAVVADEAFAKIQLYGVNVQLLTATNQCVDFNSVSLYSPIPSGHLVYPSTNFTTSQQYSWSAICRLVNSPSRSVQVTVFVCRKIGIAPIYRDPLAPLTNAISYPMPVLIAVSQNAPDELSINNVNEITLINDGYTIVDNETGWIYRVLQRYPNQPTVIQLDRNWQGNLNSSVWVIPPTFSGSKSPCVGVFQKVISF